MTSVGYVYVLINPAMAGMVKVGMTTREPEDRVDELSSATGVPSQFILVYKEYFEDCVLAEKMAHEILEGRGCRVAKNREFFNVPVPEAINVMLEIKKHFQENILVENAHNVDYPKSSQNTDIDNLVTGILEEALNYYYGSEGYLQDNKEASKLFKKAAKLGSGEAYRFLGDLSLDFGNSDWCFGSLDKTINPKKIEKALDFYKKGHQNGDRVCLARMGQLYSTRLSENSDCYHLLNSNKCMEDYFEKVKNVEPEYTDRYIIWRFLEYLNYEFRNRDRTVRDGVFRLLNGGLFENLELIANHYHEGSNLIEDELQKLKYIYEVHLNPKESELFMFVDTTFCEIIMVDIISGTLRVGEQVEVFADGLEWEWDSTIKTVKSIEKLIDDDFDRSMEYEKIDTAYAEEYVGIEFCDTTGGELRVLWDLECIYIKKVAKSLHR